jgi:hypothetical protein
VNSPYKRKLKLTQGALLLIQYFEGRSRCQRREAVSDEMYKQQKVRCSDIIHVATVTEAAGAIVAEN